MSQNSPQETTPEPTKTGKNGLEWIVFGLSSLLVVGILSWLTYQAMGHTSNPPRLEISLGEPVKAGNRVLVPVTVENRGDATAAGVEVEVTRRSTGQSEKESASFSFPHLPRSGSREGWVAFDAPLRNTELSAKISGYEEP